MKVAIVHDWLVSYAGSERVVQALADLYPNAPIYTSVYDEQAVGQFFPADRVRTTFLQRVPFAKGHYQALLPLMPLAFETLNLSEFDLVISSSHACSKGVITRPDAVHICYCHTPIRYVWSHYSNYLSSIRRGPKRWMAAWLLHRLRNWDFAAAQRVDYFIANSTEVQRRIAKYYRRTSQVIHPPVKLLLPNDAQPHAQRDYWLSLGRLVPYKRVDLAVQACTALGERLVVAGDGPQRRILERMAGPTVEFVGRVSEQKKINLLTGAKGLLFLGEEDYGIVPAEAIMMGTPVLAYAKGGVIDTVEDGVNGALVAEPTVDAVARAISEFDIEPWSVDVETIGQCGFSSSFRKIVDELTHVSNGGVG